MVEATTGAETSLDPEAVRIGATIRSLRKSSRMTLKELGEAVGKTHHYLSKIERGQKPAPRELIVDIAEAMCVPFVSIVRPDYQRETAEADA